MISMLEQGILRIHTGCNQGKVDMVVRFQQAWQHLHIANDDFIRTTEPRHISVVETILQDLWERGEIYKGAYEGWNCVPDERFWTEKDLVDGHCPDCGLILWRREKDYFHRCPGSHPVPYQQERQAICNQCPHNVDDICVEYHALHPDRDCVISVGVEIPYAACPLGKWPAVQHDCLHCGRRTFSLTGIDHCRWCGGVS